MDASGRTIEVFADVLCPFTHVGVRRLVERRAELGRNDLHLWLRAWPLEVINGEPMDAGFIAEEVAEIREQVAPDLFAGFERNSFPSTALPALALASAAYRSAPEIGERVSIELRDLVFEAGEDISDPAVLDRVAIAHGLVVSAEDADRVHADRAEGVTRGVIGSPHFFTPTASFFCPALNVGRDAAGALKVTPDQEGFASFLEACFG